MPQYYECHRDKNVISLLARVLKEGVQFWYNDTSTVRRGGGLGSRKRSSGKSLKFTRYFMSVSVPSSFEIMTFSFSQVHQSNWSKCQMYNNKNWELKLFRFRYINILRNQLKIISLFRIWASKGVLGRLDGPCGKKSECHRPRDITLRPLRQFSIAVALSARAERAMKICSRGRDECQKQWTLRPRGQGECYWKTACKPTFHQRNLLRKSFVF